MERNKRSSSSISRPHSHGKRKLKKKPQKNKRKRKGQKSGYDALKLHNDDEVHIDATADPQEQKPHQGRCCRHVDLAPHSLLPDPDPNATGDVASERDLETIYSAAPSTSLEQCDLFSRL